MSSVLKSSRPSHSLNYVSDSKLPKSTEVIVSIVRLFNPLLYRTTDLVVFLLSAEGERALDRRQASGNSRNAGLHNAVYLHYKCQYSSADI